VEALERLAEPALRERVDRDCREWAGGFGWERMHAQVLAQTVEAVQQVRGTGRG